MKEYNMPPLGLFGKRCRIKHASNLKEGFVYRIVNDGIRSNCWTDIPLGYFDSKPKTHNTSEDIVIVVCDTLIDDHSKLERVRLKDIEIMNEQEPCDNEDIAVKSITTAFQLGMAFGFAKKYDEMDKVMEEVKKAVTPQPKMRQCKDCKYFEYDHVEKVYGIPLIAAHEICLRWGDGSKTREDGYCFLFEPQESEVNK